MFCILFFSWRNANNTKSIDSKEEIKDIEVLLHTQSTIRIINPSDLGYPHVTNIKQKYLYELYLEGDWAHPLHSQ